jgi:hypothetical protein
LLEGPSVCVSRLDAYGGLERLPTASISREICTADNLRLVGWECYVLTAKLGPGSPSLPPEGSGSLRVCVALACSRQMRAGSVRSSWMRLARRHVGFGSMLRCADVAGIAMPSMPRLRTPKTPEPQPGPGLLTARPVGWGSEAGERRHCCPFGSRDEIPSRELSPFSTHPTLFRLRAVVTIVAVQ